jgi:Phage integrase family
VVSKQNNVVLTNGLKTDNERQPTSIEKQYARELETRIAGLRKLGPCESVDRFLRGYGKLGTKRVYASNLLMYFKWLRMTKKVELSPDELIKDNLMCVFKSDPTDAASKRKHTDWLSEYVNSHLLQKGSPEDSRTSAASAIKRFYESNDATLFGDFRVSSQDPRPPAPALRAEEIRTVLKAMPIHQCLPLLIIWQSSAEINRTLALTWGDVRDEYPLKLQFYGRKRHKKAYHTYIGRDAIAGLKLWRERWTELQGKIPGPNDLVFMGKGGPMDSGNLNAAMKDTALALFRQGLILNGNPESWHSHALRHSFETESSHAGVKGEIRDYLEGHISGITWTYNHRDEIHPQDFEKEWLKIEPYVSLEPDRTALQNEFEGRETTLLRRLEAAEALLSALKREFDESPRAQSQAAR